MKSMRTGIFLILLLLAAIVIEPMVSANEFVKNDGADASVNNITMNIISPKEEAESYIDVLGNPITVEVDVKSPNGIKEVYISNGINQSICSNTIGNRYRCLIPWQPGRNSNKITATDNSGNSISKIRNYTLVIGQQPPPTINTSPQNTSLSGFGFLLGICSVLIGLLIITFRER